MSKNVFPGVRGGHGKVESLERAVRVATEAAIEAGQMGSFAVGGLLVGPQREILAVSRNRVIEEGCVADPTAHGERQLVDYYYAHQDRLPPAEQCTIFSSLDPCMMCTGSILAAGMKVVSLTLDTENGVNYDARGTYHSLPEELREQARATFAYLGVEGHRTYQGYMPFLFPEQRVPEQALRDAEAAFWSGQRRVSALVHADLPPRNVLESEVALEHLRGFWSEGARVKTDPENPGTEVLEHLLRGEALLVDPFGNLLLAARGQTQASPIRTPVVELIRAWTRVRGGAPEGVRPYLPHLKRCRVLTLYGPGRGAPDIMMLGAYASAIEGSLPSGGRHWQYLFQRQSAADLRGMLDAFPPYYRNELAPDIVQLPADLVEAARSRLPSPDRD